MELGLATFYKMCIRKCTLIHTCTLKSLTACYLFCLHIKVCYHSKILLYSMVIFVKLTDEDFVDLALFFFKFILLLSEEERNIETIAGSYGF